MSTYTKTTNFTAKDNLTSGDPAKVIKGSEFDTEFNSIETAVNSKADANNGTHTGTTTISTADIDTLQIDSVEVTATSAELNTLDGITSTTAELNKLDGFTGTVDDLNYAKDLRATGVTSAELDKIDGLTADSTELNILDGATVTTAELNTLDGITASTAELNVTDGLTATTAELNTLDGITSTTAELNVLDGITATTAELNVLDGVTSTTAEINKLDGFTGTVADLNYAKDLRATGVTTAELDVLDGITATTAELNITDGLTATTAELNTLDGITATTTELNYTDGVTSNIQTQLDSMVEKAGDTMTGDLSLGDNVKAKFGASNDLEIFHDGSKSIIKDSGTGNLFIRGDNLVMTDGDGTEFIRTATDSAVTIKHAGNTKLETTSTGVDVTGTVTADGLTVDGNASLNGDLTITDTLGDPFVKFATQDQEYVLRIDNSDNDIFQIRDTSNNANRIGVANSGDVSFYEDTGTTAKFVWDSSAEKLTIDGSEEATSLSTAVTGSVLELNGNSGGSAASWFGSVSGGGQYVQSSNSSGTTSYDFLINPYGGNVGIGTASPNRTLEIKQSTPAVRLTDTAADDYAEILATDGDLILRSDEGNTHASSVMRFEVDSSERMRIDSSGNVGIGRTNPSSYVTDDESLYVKGQIRVDGITNTASVPALAIDDTNSGIFSPAANTLGFSTAAAERARIDASGNVGIGTVAPQTNLQVKSGTGGNAYISVKRDNATSTDLRIGAENGNTVINSIGSVPLAFYTNSAERARIDSSGNLLVGKTSSNPNTQGVQAYSNGILAVSKDSGRPLYINRNTTDGALVDFVKDGSAVGSIGTVNFGDLYIGTDDTGIYFNNGVDAIFPHNTITNLPRDNAIDIGYSNSRFKDLYLSGGVYLGGTGAANKLDDYEEGTWTPATGAGNISGTSITYAGKYTKIGRLVVLYFRASNTVGDINVSSYQLFSGIPFTVDGMVGTSTVITEDIDQFDRQGFASVGGTSFAISNCGSSSGTTVLEATVSYYTNS